MQAYIRVLTEPRSEVPENFSVNFSGKSWIYSDVQPEGFLYTTGADWILRCRKTKNRRLYLSMEAAPQVFATTHWSLVLAGANADIEEQKRRQALAELCRIYWRPAFSYICRRGYSPEDAQDLTQDFFVMILESDWLQRADESRGRFRSFLLKSLQNFLSHATERDRARKRGGGLTFISWDEWTAKAASQMSIPAQVSDALPERLFEWRWATTVVEKALQRLREECEARGRLRLFETLSAYLTTERGETSYASLAASLGIAETVVKKQLHNLRQRYRWLLREEVSQTLENPADIDDEIRHLCAALAAAA